MDGALHASVARVAGREPREAEPASLLRLSELIGALSYALDLTEGQPPGHCLRCCWIGMQIGVRLGLRSDRLSDLYYTLLLKDAGCSSNAARLWQLYGGDDRTIKHDFKTVDQQSRMQVIRFLLRHTGVGEALHARLRRLAHLAQNGEALALELVHTRCERGAGIATRFGFGEHVAAGIHSLDEHWNGKGRPDGLAGRAIPVAARIALLAQVADVFHTAGGPAAARNEVRARSGSWFDPCLAALFLELSRDLRFWEALAPEGLQARVAAMEPVSAMTVVNEGRLDAIAAAFADVVDAKSSFTGGHSRRVAEFTEAIALRLGLPPERRRWLSRGALLHDIGKLGVSNGILDKPGRLDAAEWTAVRRHPQFSEEILGHISVFGDLAAIVGAHHERLDGQGYPKGLKGEAITLETRIITTADIFDAVTAARPYRAAVPVPGALAMMERDRGTALDGRCLDALRQIAADPEQPGQ
jgi:HD-GYP domain-containing protein (c-di-GMP phosphodiesterase class II)